MSHTNEHRRSQNQGGRRLMQEAQSESASRRSAPKRRPKKKRSLGATIAVRFFQVLGTLILIGIVTGAFMACYAVVYVKSVIMPKTELDLSAYTLSQNSIIYYLDKDTGLYQELTTLVGEKNTEWVDLEDIPEALVNAVVSIEDKRFWEHDGVDWYRTGGAVINMFIGMKNNFGGSTITQQLIKNVTEYDDVTVTRKIQEIFTALELEKNYKKEDILELYLNLIYLGSDCYGVQAAAQKYFDKDVSELSLAECASLAGITNNPSLYGPWSSVEVTRWKCSACERYTNAESKPDLCQKCGAHDSFTEAENWTSHEYNKQRQELILGQMLTLNEKGETVEAGNGYITQAEYDAAVAQELNFCVRGGKSDTDGDGVAESTSRYTWYVETVISEVRDDLVETLGLSSRAALQQVYSGGLSIYTNFDPDVQAAVDEIYQDRSNLDKTSADGQQIKSAMTIVDNSTGYVVAIAGDVGAKTKDRIYNWATIPHQPGSSIKPLSVYSPAVEMGLITPGTVIDDNPLTLDGKVWPKNDGNSYKGLMTVQLGLAKSLNTISVRTLQLVTPEASFQFLTERYKFTTLESGRTDRAGNYLTDIGLSPLAMGGLTDGVSTYEMAAAFATFPRNGVYTEPTTYLKVTKGSGTEETVLLDNTPADEQVIKPSTAYYMNAMLKNAVQTGTGTPARISGMTVAGKTGTTNDSYARWFAGYTPYYTGVVWVGYEYNAEIKGFSTNPAVAMWKKVMTVLHEDLENKDFETTEETVKVSICTSCGKLAVDGVCDADIRGESQAQTFSYIKGDEPTDTCTCHVPLEICLDCPILDAKGEPTGRYCLAGEFCPEESRKTVYVVDYERELATDAAAIGDYTALRAYYTDLGDPVCTVHDGISVDPDPWNTDWLWPDDPSTPSEWIWPSVEPTLPPEVTGTPDPEETESQVPDASGDIWP